MRLKRLKINDFRLKIFIVVFLLLLINHQSFFINPIYALEPSQAATSSPDLKSKLKALQDEIASRASQLKNEVSKKLQNKAYVGFVKSESPEAITLATDKGTKLININDYTQYTNLVKGVKNKNIKDLATDDYVVALGDVDETSVLTAKKIVKFTSDEEVKRQAVFGDVLTLGSNTLGLQTRQNQNITINTTGSTIYRTTKGQSLSFEDIKFSKPIIVIGKLAKEGVVSAEFVYILPYTSNFKPKVATSSTKVASPSGTRSKTNRSSN